MKPPPDIEDTLENPMEEDPEALFEAKQEAETQANKIIQAQEEIKNDPDYKFQPTYIHRSAGSSVGIYKPPQRGNHDRESPQDEWCIGCVEWQVKPQSNCAHKDALSPSSSTYSLLPDKHSIH